MVEQMVESRADDSAGCLVALAAMTAAMMGASKAVTKVGMTEGQMVAKMA